LPTHGAASAAGMPTTINNDIKIVSRETFNLFTQQKAREDYILADFPLNPTNQRLKRHESDGAVLLTLYHMISP